MTDDITSVERVQLRAAALGGGTVTTASEAIELALIDKGLAENLSGSDGWAFPILTADGWAASGVQRPDNPPLSRFLAEVYGPG